MRKTFIETREFTEWVDEYLSDEGLSYLQRALLNDPNTGSVIPGCGGLRKMRVPDSRRGKGKRGGARVIYLHIPEVDQIHFITVYGKDQKDDLSVGDKSLYRQLVQILKDQSRRSKIQGKRASMNDQRERLPVADQIRKGLEEAILHAKGEIALESTTLEMPDPPPEVGAKELTKLRLTSGMSQAVFARLLNVPTKTVQSWERGARKPSRAVLRLIQVFRQDPSAVLQVVGMSGRKVQTGGLPRPEAVRKPSRS